MSLARKIENCERDDLSDNPNPLEPRPNRRADRAADNDQIDAALVDYAQPRPRPQASSRSSLGCMVVAGILGVSMVASALIIAGTLRSGFNTATDIVTKGNPANVIATMLPPVTPTIVVRPPVIRTVQALADLTTYSALMSTVVDVNQPRVGSLVNERLLLVACGKVNAGVDLNQMTEDDVAVSEDGKTVTVRLPKADLKDVFLIDDATQPCTTKVYDRTNLIVLPETMELEGQAREKAVQAIRDTAIQSGMLGEANKNARAVVERVLLMAGYEKVVFVEE